MKTANRILVTLPFPQEWVPKFADCIRMANEAGYEVVVAPGDMTEEQLRPWLPGVCAAVCSGDYWTRAILEEAPELKVLSRMGVGYDRVDVPAATEHGVALTITRGANAPDVAEYTLALLLAASRRLRYADQSVRNGEWPKVFSHSLYHKTLGILGFGNIGRQLAKLVGGFDMQILACDQYRDEAYAQAHGVRYVELDELLSQCDILSIHAPLNESTRGIIGREAFAKMKKNVILVNCARGGIVDEDALLEAVEAGKVYAAALDATDQEPLSAGSPLIQSDALLLSPHTAGLTYEGRGLLIEKAFINALDVLAGRMPRDIINPDAMKG